MQRGEEGTKIIGYEIEEKIYLGPYFTIPKINSRWIIEINVKDTTIKLVKDNIEEYLYDLGLGKVFLNRTQRK